MTKYATMNPLGSTSPYDLFDNAQNFDLAFNSITAAIWKDRFGRSRKSYWGIEQDFVSQLLNQQLRFNNFIQNAGYKVIGDYETGPLTITEYNELIRYENELWKLTAATAIPYITTGNDATSWADDSQHFVSVGDAALRQSLARDADGEGDALISVCQPLKGSASRTQHDKNAEYVTMFDFGGISGDGVTDDSAGVAVIEALSDAPVIYGLGKTYAVSVVPTSKRYSDGWWSVNGVLTPFNHTSVFRANDRVIAIGPNAALAHAGARNCIAIGEDALRSNTLGRHNIAFGISALHFLNGTSSTSLDGSRNIAIGGNAGRFMDSGSRNIVMGRDAGHNLTAAHLNVIIGHNSVMGIGPNTLDPGVIENQTPLTPSQSVVIGAEAGKFWNAARGVLIGNSAGYHTKSDTGIVGIGNSAFALHQSDLSYWGTVQNLVTLSGTYSQAGSKTITVTAAGHGMATGFRVLMRFVTGANADVSFQDDNWYLVTVTDANTFTIQSPVSATATGTVAISAISTTTPYSRSVGGCTGVGREVGNGVANYRSTAVGDRAAAHGMGSENVAIGYMVHTTEAPGNSNAAVGTYSQQYATATASANASLGTLSLGQLTTGKNNTGIGTSALRQLTTGTGNTGVGVESLRFAIDGSAHNFNNCSGVGAYTKCSGDNQVQLGDSTTTTYSFGAVQQRSDERDKADKREIDGDLAVKFVRGLVSYFYKFDYRDDYFEEYTVQTGIDADAQPVFEKRIRPVEKDGSKKRNRDHAGYLAQQVKALMDELGIDFGMYQDHLVNGGCDIKTLAYEQTIPFVTKALDVAFSKLEGIESRLKKLDGQ